MHFGVRLEDASQCILVVIGATAEGKKELVTISDGYRESEASWREVLLDLKARGLNSIRKWPSAMGPWDSGKQLPQVFGTTRRQRCWVHKTANVLNKLPKGQQPKAKTTCRRSGWRPLGWTPTTRSITFLLSTVPSIQRQPMLDKDRDPLFTFYDFPAEHWLHLRTTNPIESTFATVRLRTDKTRGCVSRESVLAMVFSW